MKKLRWNEARKIWGSIGVETRTIARQAKAWVERGSGKSSSQSRNRDGKREEEEGRTSSSSPLEDGVGATRRNLAELLSWCAAAPIALKAAVATNNEGIALLKGTGHCHSDGGGFEGVLTRRQSKRLWRATGGKPLLAPPCVLDRISSNLASLPLSDILLCTLDARVAAIAALASAADRLKRQPIPPAYTRNTARFLAVRKRQRERVPPPSRSSFFFFFLPHALQPRLFFFPGLALLPTLGTLAPVASVVYTCLRYHCLFVGRCRKRRLAAREPAPSAAC